VKLRMSGYTATPLKRAVGVAGAEPAKTSFGRSLVVDDEGRPVGPREGTRVQLVRRDHPSLRRLLRRPRAAAVGVPADVVPDHVPIAACGRPTKGVFAPRDSRVRASLGRVRPSPVRRRRDAEALAADAAVARECGTTLPSGMGQGAGLVTRWSQRPVSSLPA